MTYDNSRIHKIYTDEYLVGGDFEFGDGTGGESIYGKHFDDENYKLNFEKPYLLAMASDGPDQNGSKFLITFKELEFLDEHYVIFGEVISGFEVVNKISSLGSGDGNPSKNIIVKKSGLLK